MTSTRDSQEATRREPRERHAALNGAELAFFEWGVAQPDRPSYLFCHATGFHARCWDEIVRLLPNDAHVVALDMRGHGRSSKTPPYKWQNFGNDVQALVEHLDLYGIVGVGHSMGGHSIAKCAAAVPKRFERLVLVDPVVMDPDSYHLAAGFGFTEPSEHPIARRKGDFDSWLTMYERFKDREPYSLWREAVLRDYCRHGVLPREGGGVTLACPPVVEATVYIETTKDNIQHLLGAVVQPVTVLRARERERDGEAMDFAGSPTWPGLAAAFPDGADIYLPELTHFMAMQSPELVARCALQRIVSRDELVDLLAPFAAA